MTAPSQCSYWGSNEMSSAVCQTQDPTPPYSTVRSWPIREVVAQAVLLLGVLWLWRVVLHVLTGTCCLLDTCRSLRMNGWCSLMRCTVIALWLLHRMRSLLCPNVLGIGSDSRIAQLASWSGQPSEGRAFPVLYATVEYHWAPSIPESSWGVWLIRSLQISSLTWMERTGFLPGAGGLVGTMNKVILVLLLHIHPVSRDSSFGLQGV
jgi:hypothetical protein